MGFPQKPRVQPPSDMILASFCGKNMSNWIERYDPSTNSWTCVGPIPGLKENHVLKGFSMAAIGTSIFVIGGRLCHKHHRLPNATETDTEVRPTVIRLDVRTNTWFDCAPMAMPRFDFACTVCNNKIYVAGGQSALASARGISSAEMYDPVNDTWTPLPNMNTLRYKCVGVTWRGKVYVVGGFAERGDSDRPEPYDLQRSSAEVMDPSGSGWDLVEGMWQLDVPPNQIVAVDDRLLSSGDCLNAWKGHVEAYDVNLNIWNIVERSRSERLCSSVIKSKGSEDEHVALNQRMYLTMAPIGTQLYFLAGYRVAGKVVRRLSVVHIFDTLAVGDGWRSLEATEEEGDKELCSHCCVLQLVS